ncbi:MAG: hypothetical protein AAGB12_00120 [Pseudomonadota bacterium]
MMSRLQTQKGSTLLTALVLISILAIVGLSSLSNALITEKISVNNQQMETAFFSAQAAINVYIAEANSGESGVLKETRDKADINALMKDNTSAFVGCVDGETGDIDADCNNTVFNEVGLIKSKVSATYKGCHSKPAACSGYSLNMGSMATGCHEYEIEGEGWYADSLSSDSPSSGDIKSKIKQTVTQIALCVDETIPST